MSVNDENIKILVPKSKEWIHHSKVVKYMGSMSAIHCKNEMATGDKNVLAVTCTYIQI